MAVILEEAISLVLFYFPGTLPLLQALNIEPIGWLVPCYVVYDANPITEGSLCLETHTSY
jgi:hypothetical protein